MTEQAQQQLQLRQQAFEQTNDEGTLQNQRKGNSSDEGGEASNMEPIDVQLSKEEAIAVE